MHWRNAIERLVRAINNHFISALCTVDHNLRFYLCRRVLTQVIITLNMLQLSRINPKLSVYEQVD